MNERIKELLLKAGFTNAYTDPKEGFELVFVDEEHTTESAAKFAELIVRECVSICMKNQFDGAENYNNGSVSSAEFIKEHFGVEE
jgi:hypothetical protein